MIGGGVASVLAVFADLNQTAIPNSVSLVAHTELRFNILSLERYIFLYHLFYQTTGVADIQFDITGPVGATGNYGNFRFNSGGGGTNAAGAINGTGFNANGGGVGVTNAISIMGSVLNAGLNGEVNLRFAQNTAEVSDTIILAGSFLIAIRI